jgi:phage terminase large subunit GpA-like protein
MPFEGLPDARAAVQAAWARGTEPPPRRTVDQWADAQRILGEEEGPNPGRWDTNRTPYLRDPMACMSLHHPSRRVVLLAGAQCGKTQAELNAVGQMMAETPATILWVLPTVDEAKNFNRDKLDPLISNTPAVKARVSELVARDETGSTIMRKRFPGGVLELTGANSSKGLQSRTRRVIVMDEVAEFPADAGGRGDPVAQAEARTIAWTGREKIIAVSTPGLDAGDPGPGGRCRITQMWEDGSRGRYLVPCPDCGRRQELQFEQLRWTANDPGSATYACEACGVLIPHAAKRRMLADGAWDHERPELVSFKPSFRLNGLYSPFADWSHVARLAEESSADPGKAKSFSQQWLGRAYKPALDVPKPEVLRERTEDRPMGRIPPGVLWLEGATDVQAERLEWAVYGFDRNLTQYYIDGGIIVGDTNLPAVWDDHDAILARSWPDAWGREWRPERWGVDSGFRTQAVYRYVRRHAAQRRPQIMALDGRPKWGLPPVGSASVQDVDADGRKIGQILLWPVGTWDLKSELATALALTVQGPDTNSGAWPRGAMRFPRGLDIAFFQSLTAEALVMEIRGGQQRPVWRKLGANEQWDLAVYTRALARFDADRLTEADWSALAAERLAPPEDAQGDLLQVLGPDLKAEAEAAARRKVEEAADAANRAAVAQAAAARGGQAGWFDRRRDWF